VLQIVDPRLRLIDALIRFANGGPGGHPSKVFSGLIQETRAALRSNRLPDTLKDLHLKQHRQLPDSDSLIDLRAKTRSELLETCQANGDPVLAWATGGIPVQLFSSERQQRRRQDLAREHIRVLGRAGPRALVVSGLIEREGAFQDFSVPLWTDAYTCIKDARALIFADYKGVRSRISVCPFLRGTAEPPIDPNIDFSNWWGQLVNSARIDIHFFADLRYIKGPRMRYCSKRHQKAHYMQQYRRSKRVKKSK
jgi:hypothetical protein